MSASVFAARRERARKLMREQGLDALLVSHAANRYYLSGFELHDPQCNESAGRLILMADGHDLLCTDARYDDAAKRLWPEDRVVIYGQDAPEDIAGRLRDLAGGRRVRLGFEARLIRLDFYERLFADKSLEAVRADGLVEGLRLLKDADEIRRMEASCRLNQQLMDWLPERLDPGRSEAEIAWDVEVFFRERGASELAFASIVARGPNAALPHAVPGRDAVLGAEDLVLVDVGCRLDDYCSDQTRTFWAGANPSPRFRETLALVQEAQARAIEMIRPGVAACDVYAAARNLFARHHKAHAFTHGLGHGVGLETHEGPALNNRSHTLLEPGMIVTVEPGLYDAAWGGVRWEHMVLVTENGHRVL